eukprot:ANDGO_02851.mRNA.1 hypothetical protein
MFYDVVYFPLIFIHLGKFHEIWGSICIVELKTGNVVIATFGISKILAAVLIPLGAND